MKLMKAMKKLKFWPKMKKRKKHHHHHLLSSSPPPQPTRPPPPPAPLPPCYHYYNPLPPSAPPLPPWLEYRMQIQETMIFTSEASNSWSLVDQDTSNKTLLSTTQENNSGYNRVVKKVEEGPVWKDHNASNTTLLSTTLENDMVVRKVEEGSALKRLERRGELLGGFGCVVSFGAHLVRCVFPCFTVPDEPGENIGGCSIEKKVNDNDNWH